MVYSLSMNSYHFFAFGNKNTIYTSFVAYELCEFRRFVFLFNSILTKIKKMSKKYEKKKYD